MFPQESLLRHLWVYSTFEHFSVNVLAFDDVLRANVPQLPISPAGRFRRDFDYGQGLLQLLVIEDRIAVGDRALSTAVRLASSAQAKEWELESTTPQLDPASDKASGFATAGFMIVETLTLSTSTPGSVTFGELTCPHRK